MTYTCSCGGSYAEAIVKLGHDYGKTKVTAPTCTSEGYTTHTCSRCSDSYKDTYTNKASHEYHSTVTAPTCTEKGYTTHVCKSCSHSYNDTYTNAAGHHYTSKVTKAATCTATGVKTYTCSKCSNSYTESIKAIGHNYTSKVTAPTCTAQGYTTYTCANCSDSYKDSYKNATGHKNTKTETKAAGCVTDGYTKVVCADCGTVISSQTVPSNGSHAHETMRLYPDAAALNREKKGTWVGNEGYYEVKYRDWTDWNVQICRDCGEIDTSTIEFAYTDYEAAEIMLSYVNELREEVYGTDYYNLKIDPTLQELAQIRAKEIAENGMYAEGTYAGGAHEIMRDGGIGLRETFDDWATLYASSISNKSYIYFGYGKYEINDTSTHSAGFYGIMLFWTGFDRSDYLYG